MILFRPVGINEYNAYVQLEFKAIPAELIEQGNFLFYFDDIEAHRIAKKESMRNSEWGYVSFIIQYCIEESYINYIRNTQKNRCEDKILKDILVIPKQEATNVNKSILGSACVIGFYYNTKNKFTTYPLEKNELRRLQIIQYYNHWDPMGFIDMHTPRDEYYGEINNIVARISENTSTEELAFIIKDVTEKAFGVDYLKRNSNIEQIALKIDEFL